MGVHGPFEMRLPARLDGLSGGSAEVQHVQQEPPDEFISRQGHRFDLITPAIIFPPEAHLVVFDVEQPVIGYGDAMGIPAHVIEHLLRQAVGLYFLNFAAINSLHCALPQQQFLICGQNAVEDG